MAKKTVITLLVFLFAGACVFGVCSAFDQTVGLPQAITQESPCPATGCASGECHGFDNVPEPDGIHELSCPKASCSSVECHAWETLENRYHQASDASLNLWILSPVVLVLALVLFVRKVK